MKKNNIEISTDMLPDSSELLNLFRQTSWANNRIETDVKFLLENTKTFVVVKSNKEMIGFGRAISDGIYRAMIDDVVVHQNYRNKGVGALIIKTLMQQLDTAEQVFLNTKPELEGFYNSLGFSKSTCLTMNT